MASPENRMVLSFDASCVTCSGLASSLQNAVGDRLGLVSFASPRMGRWRKETLGDEAPWAPTLVRLKDGSPDAAWGSLTAQAFAALLDRVAAHDERFAWLPEVKLATLDESTLRVRALALRDEAVASRSRNEFDLQLLRACATEVVELWSQLPAIRDLGVDGVLAFLDEAGFAAAR